MRLYHLIPIIIFTFLVFGTTKAGPIDTLQPNVNISTINMDLNDYSVNISIKESDTFIDGVNDSIIIVTTIEFDEKTDFNPFVGSASFSEMQNGNWTQHQIIEIWNNEISAFNANEPISKVVTFKALKDTDFNVTISFIDVLNTSRSIYHTEIITLEGTVSNDEYYMETELIYNQDTESELNFNCTDAITLKYDLYIYGVPNIMSLKTNINLNDTLSNVNYYNTSSEQNYTSFNPYSLVQRIKLDFNIDIPANGSYIVSIIVEGNDTFVFLDSYQILESSVCVANEVTDDYDWYTEPEITTNTEEILESELSVIETSTLNLNAPNGIYLIIIVTLVGFRKLRKQRKN